MTMKSSPAGGHWIRAWLCGLPQSSCFAPNIAGRDDAPIISSVLRFSNKFISHGCALRSLIVLAILLIAPRLQADVDRLVR